jgi:hypothetical protein
VVNTIKQILPSVTKRKIQVALGLLWLLDGALQLQRQMFTSNFANNVISPAAQGQPRFVSGVVHFGTHILLLHPAIFNTLIAIIQLGLGVLILWRRTAKFGIISSILWGLFVWYVGEGLGGLASWQTLILIGAPGAALLYSIIALGVLPKKDHKKDDKSPASWLVIVWALLWIIGAIYQLLPGQNTVSDLSSMISGMANGAPGWLASLDIHTANFINDIGGHTSSMSNMHMTAVQMTQMHTTNGSGFWFILLLAIAQASIGLLALFSGYWRKIAIGAGVILSIIFWIIGQSLGGYYTGLATDPSSAPLFILLGITVLGSTQDGFSKFWHHVSGRLEHLLT